MDERVNNLWYAWRHQEKTLIDFYDHTLKKIQPLNYNESDRLDDDDEKMIPLDSD